MGGHFVVWSCGGGVNGTDLYANARVVAAEDFEQAWSAMIGGGADQIQAPRDDDFPVGPRPWSRIDVYLLGLGECRLRHCECEPIEGKELAAAIPDRPCDSSRGAPTSTGYLIVKASSVPGASGSSIFRNTAAHELFHLSEFGLNLAVGGQGCSEGDAENPPTPIDSGGPSSWLYEASAEWASHSFFPDDDPARRTTLFEAFQRYRDNARQGLQTTSEHHDYDAFLYPTFIKQETGTSSTIMSMWATSSTLQSAEDLDERLDDLYPFIDHFRDFTVRNFNKRLPGDPIVPYADGALPFDSENHRPLIAEPGVRFDTQRYTGTRPLRIAPLAMQIDHVREIPPELRWIKFDATDGGQGHVSLDALVKVGSSWERRRLDSPVLEICRDDPGDEDVEEVYLIFSNFSYDRVGGRIGSEYDVEKGPLCPGGWRGTMRVVVSTEEHTSYDDANGHYSLDVSNTETQEWIIGETRTDGDEELIDARWHAVSTTSRVEVDPNLGCPRTTTTFGTGDGEGDTTFRVLFQGDLVGTLQPSSIPNQGSLESHTAVEDCENATEYDQPPGILYEAFQLFGTVDFSFLQDDADQTSFAGSTTILHDDDGQGRIIDITGTWDLHRTVDP